MPGTVVVTSINSFLGYHLALAFKQASYDVVGTYHTSASAMTPLRRLRWERARASVSQCVQLDMTDANAVQMLIADARPQCWIHQTGLGHNFTSEDYDLAEATRLNLLPLTEIFSGMARIGGSVVMTGSGMEYGAAESPNQENAACLPQSPYGLARLSATLRARQLAQRFAVPTRVARVFTVFGHLDAEDRLVPRLFDNLRRGKAVGLAPGVARDICSVADVAQGFLRLASDRGDLFDIFNLSCGTATPLFDIARLVATEVGADPALITEDISKVRIGEPQTICGSGFKAFTKLGWSARPLIEGIRHYANLEHPGTLSESSSVN